MGQPQCGAFADFCRVNTPTLAAFKLPNVTRGLEGMSAFGSCEPGLTGFPRTLDGSIWDTHRSALYTEMQIQRHKSTGMSRRRPPHPSHIHPETHAHTQRHTQAQILSQTYPHSHSRPHTPQAHTNMQTDTNAFVLSTQTRRVCDTRMHTHRHAHGDTDTGTHTVPCIYHTSL